VIETPVQFGTQQSLVGVLSMPAAPGPTAVLLFNAGVIPRIGPHRLNVKMARDLAQRGHIVLRMDLAGQGDSRYVAVPGQEGVSAVADLRAAMDHVQQTTGVARFAVIGICSGALNGFAAALADERVVAVLMFDGFWYRSRWSRLVRDWKRFRDVSWRDVMLSARRRLSGALRLPGQATESPGIFDGSEAMANPPKASFVRDVGRLVDRGVALFFMYGGSVIDYYSYGAQFRHAFGREPWWGRVRCEFHPQFDHTFVTREAQLGMISIVGAWLAELGEASVGR